MEPQIEIDKNKDALESKENKLSNAEEKKSEEMDEEGLRKQGYDVILCGTGLTQSILAASLARAGKSILHCDSNDFYGDMDAVLSLGALIQWASNISDGAGDDTQKDQHSDEDGKIPLYASESSSVRIDSVLNPRLGGMEELEKGMSVITPYGQGRLLENDTTSLAVQLNEWIMADGKSPVAYFGRPKLENESEIIPLDMFLYKKYIESRQRSFALDLSPALLYADGDAVDGMINSGVSEYCEFKSIIGLNLFMKSSQKRLGSRSSKIEEPKATLSRVPCSKRDVFQTKLLSPMDKRRLMKFLQIASDYAIAMTSTQIVPPSTSQGDEDDHDGLNKNEIEKEVVTSLNERQLQQGRSLYRPQNKIVATSDVEVLERCIQEGMAFDTYLTEQHKLSDHMKKVVIHAMAMGSYNADISEYSTKDGMNDLCRHLQSLGKFGGTAFLVPLYGSGELSQAFCRSAAVHGATYLLRRGPKNVQIDESGKTCGVVVNGCSYDHDEVVPSKFIAANNVVLPVQMLQKRPHAGESALRVYRRISILRGKLVKNEDANNLLEKEQRHVIIIPPGDDLIDNKSVIHGIALDESVNVAPRSMNGVDTTILYLSTVSKDGDGGEKHLEKAVKSLCGDDCMELFHLSFSFEHEIALNDVKREKEVGMHICNSRGMAITAESAFVEAKRIFEVLCPGEKFLSLSKIMDDLVKESRAGLADDEDDEVKMLESAMNMIGASESDREDVHVTENSS